MQSEFKLHLNTTIAINIDGRKPSVGILVRAYPGHFTVQMHENTLVHIPYTSIVTVREFRLPQMVETVDGWVEVGLTVETSVDDDGGPFVNIG